MRIETRNRYRGFNLLETILASSLLAGVVMTIGSLSGRSISAIRLDQEVEKAWELADMQLKLIDAAGVAAFQELGQYAGDFEQAEGYSWEAEIRELEIEHLFSVQLTIQWTSDSKIRQIRCRTRFCDPPDAEEIETEEESGP